MKLYKIFLIILYILLASAVNGQDMQSFYAQIDSANLIKKTGQLNQAIMVYEDAFQKVDYVHVIYLNQVLKLVKGKNDSKRIRYYKSRIKSQNEGLSDILIKQVDSLILKDQSVRTVKYKRRIKYYKNCLSKEKCNKNSNRFLKSEMLFLERNIIDSINMDCLFSLFDQNGFIGEPLIGSRFQAVDVLLFHFTQNPNSKKMFLFLNEALKKGNITPLRYAQITDLYLQFNDTSQYYWLWPSYYKSSAPLSEKNIEKILDSRARIGIYDSKLIQIQKGDYWILQNQFNL